LCAGDAELAGPLIGISFQQPCYVHDREGKFPFDGLRRHGFALVAIGI
jgi:hypothetical protein